VFFALFSFGNEKDKISLTDGSALDHFSSSCIFRAFCRPAGVIAAKLVAVDDDDIDREFVWANGGGILRHEDSDFPYREFAYGDGGCRY
jgi:hypothetical protein